MCEHPESLIVQSLPAPKDLWEAKDVQAWKVGLDRRYSAQPTPGLGLAKSGLLLSLDRKLGESAEAENQDHWTEWSSGADGLGGLIMLASALLQ